MIYVEPVIRNGWQNSAKRAFDVGLALTIMVLTLPVQIAAALAIAFTSRGSGVLPPDPCRQGRRTLRSAQVPHHVHGRRGTQGRTDATQRDGRPSLQDEARPPASPRSAACCAKLSIDELPQLFCVLIGSMSMVGPRPALCRVSSNSGDEDVRDRLRVLPGLTGMWQVSGPVRLVVRDVQADGSLLRRQLVAVPRHQDLPADDRRRPHG